MRSCDGPKFDMFALRGCFRIEPRTNPPPALAPIWEGVLKQSLMRSGRMSQKRLAGVMACWAMGLLMTAGASSAWAGVALSEPPVKEGAPESKAPEGKAPETQAPAGARTAEEILAEFDGMKLAEPVMGTPEQQARALQERQRGVDRLNELAMELYRTSPGNERAGPLLYTRWNNMFPLDGGHQRVLEETSRVIEENTDARCVTEALFWNAIATGAINQMDPVKTIAAIDRFAAHAPKDDRGARMMMSLANRISRSETERSVAIMRRVIEKYPETEQADVARTWLRKVDGLNKPFELAFTDAITGEKVDVQAMKGKVVIIDFWATWCAPCVREMPKLKALLEEFKGELEIVGVSLDAPESEGGLTKLRKFVTDRGFGWKHYYQGKGWESEFSRSWGVSAIPRVFVVDHNGLLVETNAGPKVDEIVRRLIAAKRGA